ncbi:hypothetical protein EYZ11_005799 [Aspergillus tanneri]|uniref:Uncharacterized protein n=1 Tax=Aspergillus tanneri TaxID=1220188 RepID=A0A4S3JH27_9EURO|nr:hypothetical protein EYZ11_005799 [Aspergillus tanneri]
MPRCVYCFSMPFLDKCGFQHGSAITQPPLGQFSTNQSSQIDVLYHLRVKPGG